MVGSMGLQLTEEANVTNSGAIGAAHMTVPGSACRQPCRHMAVG